MEKIKKYLTPIIFSAVFLGTISWLFYEKHTALRAIRYQERVYKSEGLAGLRDSILYLVYRVLHKAEAYWYDLKFNIKKPEHASKVAVATIDDMSLDVYGQWPWDRHRFETILAKLYELGAKTVAFDVVFSEPEISRDYISLSFQNPLPEAEQSYQQKFGLSDDEISQLLDLIPAVGAQYFTQALRRHPNTVLGYIWQDAKSCKIYNPKDPEWQKITLGETYSVHKAAAAGLRHIDDLIDNLGALGGQGIIREERPPFSVTSPVLFPVMSCPVANESMLSTYARYQGFFNFIPDLDGIFRQYATTFGFASEDIPQEEREFLPGDAPQWFEKGTFFTSLGIKALESYWDAKVEPELVAFGDGVEGLSGLRFKRADGSEYFLKVSPDGTIRLNFFGSQAPHQAFAKEPGMSRAHPILQFSLADLDVPDLRAPEFAANYGLDLEKPLKDFIVFIGPTSLGVYDIRPSPVQTDMPGVFLHATAVARILESAAHNRAESGLQDIGLMKELILLWILGALALFVVGYFSSTRGMALVFLLLIVGLVSDYYLFSRMGWVLNSILLFLCFFVVAMMMYVYKYLTEERDRAFVKSAFEKYVSPKVVESIVKDPKKLDLGGRKEELTVLFSDIRGFTTISEKLGASELANFLNNYLSPMSDIIMENEGTIDKYMGDAIMAIFGAPIPIANHAQKAVDASLQMLKKLKELQKEWEAQGLPRIDIGIGLNTGEMSVGNMGSRKIFSYTVMGDSVNLGSRLEGINKEYGTHLIVSEFTRSKLPENYLCRQLDRVKVKGKTEPVAIFEVQEVNPTQESRQKVQEFERALELYFRQEFVQAKQGFELLAKGGDPTAEIFVQRCELFLQSPPPAQWDGTWVMTSK